MLPSEYAFCLSLLRQAFRPEFLNRLDEIIFYKPLTREAIGRIVDLLMENLNRRLAEKGLSCTLTDAAKAYIIDNGFDPLFGARPLRRYLQSQVETRLAQAILRDDPAPGTRLVADVTAGELTVC